MCWVAVGGIVVEGQEMFSELHEMCFIQWSQTLQRRICLEFQGFVAFQTKTNEKVSFSDSEESFFLIKYCTMHN